LSEPSSESVTWSRAKDVLTILVIPLLLWCVRQEIRVAKIESVVEVQEQLRSDLHDLEVQVASMRRPIETNRTDVAAIESRLDELTELVKKIDQNLSEQE
jgi:chromosome segregation ATPase